MTDRQRNNFADGERWPREFGTRTQAIDPIETRLPGSHPWPSDWIYGDGRQADHIGNSEPVYRSMYGIPGESAQQRAFRRFPINSHKPGK